MVPRFEGAVAQAPACRRDPLCYAMTNRSASSDATNIEAASGAMATTTSQWPQVWIQAPATRVATGDLYGKTDPTATRINRVHDCGSDGCSGVTVQRM